MMMMLLMMMMMMMMMMMVMNILGDVPVKWRTEEKALIVIPNGNIARGSHDPNQSNSK